MTAGDQLSLPYHMTTEEPVIITLPYDNCLSTCYHYTGLLSCYHYHNISLIQLLSSYPHDNCYPVIIYPLPVIITYPHDNCYPVIISSIIKTGIHNIIYKAGDQLSYIITIIKTGILLSLWQLFSFIHIISWLPVIINTTVNLYHI